MDNSINIEGLSYQSIDKRKESNADIDEKLSAKEVEILNQQLDRYKQDTQKRSTLAVWTQIINSVWLGSVLLILMLNDVCCHLSDSVLMTLLGTTTINVIGLAFVVLQGFFKNMNQDIDWVSKRRKKE